MQETELDASPRFPFCRASGQNEKARPERARRQDNYGGKYGTTFELFICMK